MIGAKRTKRSVVENDVRAVVGPEMIVSSRKISVWVLTLSEMGTIAGL